MTKEEAWAAFAEQYNHRLHGPSDAFKFAWDAATKAEREACAYRAGIALLGADRGLASRIDQAIRARGQS